MAKRQSKSGLPVKQNKPVVCVAILLISFTASAIQPAYYCRGSDLLLNPDPINTTCEYAVSSSPPEIINPGADTPELAAVMPYGTYTYQSTGACTNTGYSFNCPVIETNAARNATSRVAVVQARCPPMTAWVNPLYTCTGDQIDIYRNQRRADTCEARSVSSVKFGNPIYPLTGDKKEFISTGLSLGGMEMVLTYNTANVRTIHPVARAHSSDLPGLGSTWFSSLHKKLITSPFAKDIQITRGDGSYVSFRPDGALYKTDGSDTLQSISGGFLFFDASNKVLESYDVDGKLTKLEGLSGGYQLFGYSNSAGGNAPSAGYLTSVTDSNGSVIQFAYFLPSGKDPAYDGLLTSASDSAGRSIYFSYDANANLAFITWPDGHTRGFVYELPQSIWALTGVVDENASRYSTFTYDANGNATGTQHVGATDSYSVKYLSAPAQVSNVSIDNQTRYIYHDVATPSGVLVTGPNGAVIGLTPTSNNGFPLLGGASRPAGSGCGESINSSAFDAAGNIASQDDFQGARACFSYNLKNQQIARIEGLANTVDCATVLPVNATLPANARKITTTYHPDWSLPVTVTVPGAKSTTVYHGQPDPFNSNTPANCTIAPALPNGKVLPLVCKQVTQTLLANGALDTTAPNAVATSTYDTAGRMLTSTDTAGRTTSYAYYADTSFTGVNPNAVGHTFGDLQRITNPAGFVTTFDSYDKVGRILQTTDLNGIITTVSYSPRGWVTSTSTTAPGQSARTTTYAYDNVGQLTGVVAPDGTSTTMSYDAAHRLIGATDGKGNSVTYTLDNMGNRIAEQIKDPQGVLQQQMQRSFDALNRVQQVTVGQ